MNSVAEFLKKLSVRNAFSWPAFWVFFALSAVGTFAGRLETDPQWWQRLIAVSAAQMLVFAVLGIAAVLEREIHQRLTRGIVAIFWFAFAGLVRGASVGAVFDVMGVTNAPFTWSRLTGGAGAGLVAFVLLSFVVGETRRSVRISAELLERQEQLALSAEKVSAEMDVLEDKVVTRVHATIVDALTQAGTSGSADELERVATDIVRPLSHEMAQAVPGWQPPQVQALDDRIRWGDVIRQLTSDAPFLPFTTAVAVAAYSLSNLIAILGGLKAIAAVVILILAGTFILWIANWILGKALPAVPRGTKVALIVITAVLAGLAVGFLVGAFAAVGLNAPDRYGTRLFLALLISIPILGLPIAFGRAVVVKVNDDVAELRAADQRLAHSVSRLCMHQWFTQRSVALALHGPVQAMIAASAAKVSNGGDPRAIVSELQDELGNRLDPQRPSDGHASWREALERINVTWQELCQLNVRFDPQTEQALDADPIGATIAMEIVAEAVSNAIRHGKATRVDISMAINADVLDLTIANAGHAAPSTDPGLGTQLLQDCAARWQREFTDSGVSLNVSLSLSDQPSTTT